MDAIDEVLNQLIVDDKAPSVQYILFDKASIIKEYRQGLADIAGCKEVTAQSTYHAFSVTKTFTALAILQLAEMGIVDLERPIKTYLPRFPYSSNITIQQLLSHSAGLPNPIPLSWIHLSTEQASFDRNLFFERIFKRNGKVKAEPNQKFAYSNLGYVLLGQLIEQVTGKSYEQYVTANILDRIGLRKDQVGFEIPDVRRHAKGYQKTMSFTNLILRFFIDRAKYMGKSERAWTPFYPFYVNGISYGGLIGTPGAFVKYIQQLLRPENLLLSDNSKKKLFTESYLTNGSPTGMCLSWFKGQLNGHRYYAHAGGGGGYYCELRLYPDLETGSAIFFNRTGVSDERFLDQVDRFYLKNR